MRCHSKQTRTGSEGASQRGVRTEGMAGAKRLRGQDSMPASAEDSEEAKVATVKPAENEGADSSEDLGFPSGCEREPPGVGVSRGLA